MAAVDTYQHTAAIQSSISPSTVAEFSCAACSENFASAALQRAHCKSERHVYNTKRRLAGLRPISSEAWDRKIAESRAGGAVANKGTAHLKAKNKDPGSESASRGDTSTAKEEEEIVPWAPEHCLFDRRRFSSIDDNLKYMSSTYGFTIPDVEYCTDVPGFLSFLHEKITEPPYRCLFCNRRFADAADVRRHMLDMKHTRVGTQARTRRGFVDEMGTEDMEEEIEAFFDYHGSVREITEKIKDPQQKVASILRFFDKDQDGHLSQEELAALWAQASGGLDLPEGHYKSACSISGADPKNGVDAEALRSLYNHGLANLDEHFAMLQDLLCRKLSSSRQEGGVEEDGLKEEEEKGKEGGDEGEDDDGGCSSSSGETEVLECEDEDEFEEVMRILGLQPATVTENGDLRLPNGLVAGSRDVAHIWKQRGQRLTQLATAARKSGPSKRSALMLSNSTASCSGVVMTHRQQLRESKKMVAVLRRAQYEEVRMGIHSNMLQRARHLTKIRTTFGDASGGR